MKSVYLLLGIDSYKHSILILGFQEDYKKAHKAARLRAATEGASMNVGVFNFMQPVDKLRAALSKWLKENNFPVELIDYMIQHIADQIFEKILLNNNV